MKAELIHRERRILTPDSFTEVVVWQVPRPVRSSEHFYKYSLALVVKGERVLGYDNEAGKGDHRHIGATESGYRFTTMEQLLADFWKDVERWRA